MLIRTVAAVVLLAISGAMAMAAERTPAPKDAQVYIIWPPDGAVIRGGKLWVRMGLRNAGVAPKGVCTPSCLNIGAVCPSGTFCQPNGMCL